MNEKVTPINTNDLDAWIESVEHVLDCVNTPVCGDEDEPLDVVEWCDACKTRHDLPMVIARVRASGYAAGVEAALAVIPRVSSDCWCAEDIRELIEKGDKMMGRGLTYCVKVGDNYVMLDQHFYKLTLNVGAAVRWPETDLEGARQCARKFAKSCIVRRFFARKG